MAPAVAVMAPSVSAALAPGTSERWIYVRSDLKRIALYALICIGLEAVAWVVLNHTAAGPALFNSLKI